MGTDKRDRQKTARQAKIEAEMAAAKKTRTKRTAIRVAVAAVVVVGGLFTYSAVWGGDDDETAADSGDETTTSVSGPSTTAPPLVCNNPAVTAQVGREAPDPAPPPAETAPDALEITTLVPGSGEAAAAGDTVVVHYVGKMADGTVFDCSWAEGRTGEPFPVQNLGSANLIAGWNEGLIGAMPGERRRLVIGSEKAYGADGFPPDIPPDAPLAFEIDILQVQKAGTTTTTITGETPPTTSP